MGATAQLTGPLSKLYPCQHIAKATESVPVAPAGWDWCAQEHSSHPAWSTSHGTPSPNVSFISSPLPAGDCSLRPCTPSESLQMGLTLEFQVWGVTSQLLLVK